MGGTPSAVGSNKKTYTILAYLLWWITGIIFLFVGKDDPDVKWNAANSVVVLGGASVVSLILGFIPFLNIVGFVIWCAAFIYWIIFLVQAIQGTGQRIPAPLIGPYINKYVDQLAASVK
jgi:uncharacterized membrane protein